MTLLNPKSCIMSTFQDNLLIEETKFLPAVDFQSNGELKISGKIIPDHVTDFFLPLKEFVDNLNCNSVRFEINVEYINSCGLCEIMNLFHALESNPNVKEVSAVWYYEEEDEEHHEKGIILAERFSDFRFQYISYV